MVNAKIHCPPIGQVLQQRYEIIRLLGSGAFGHTYVARDLQQGKGASCLIKHFQSHRGYPHLLKTSRRIFVTEAEMLKKLGIHDQIPRFIDCFEADEQFYLAQELIVGQPLSEELSLLKHANLRDREAEVIYFLRDLLHVLDFVHSQGIIHCDVKPNNIMRRAKDGRLVLVDFGAAQPIRSPERDRDLIGTLPLKSAVAVSPSGYLAAEQLVGKPYANSDIYATGIVAIQILTGIDPAKLQLNLETNEINWQHIRTRHKSSSALNRALTAILRQMVRYNHQQRYQSAREVLRALEPLLEPARRSLLRASEPAQVVTPTPTPAEVPAAKVAEPTPTPTPVPTKTPALRSLLPQRSKPPSRQRQPLAFRIGKTGRKPKPTLRPLTAKPPPPRRRKHLASWGLGSQSGADVGLDTGGDFRGDLNVLAIAFGVYTLADGRGTDPGARRLAKANRAFQQGDLDGAIALAGSIPEDSPAHAASQQAVEQWQADWQRAARQV
ncbi:MAG: serine/threonine protein kinase, partial [Spirulinaceae cyanobacterium RM2_2_10]|nr:serine/threonine protein kinase [Spirulinaceae cyanobacterium RM2_2_10]